jgi:hypothetical protein
MINWCSERRGGKGKEGGTTVLELLPGWQSTYSLQQPPLPTLQASRPRLKTHDASVLGPHLESSEQPKLICERLCCHTCWLLMPRPPSGRVKTHGHTPALGRDPQELPSSLLASPKPPRAPGASSFWHLGAFSPASSFGLCVHPQVPLVPESTQAGRLGGA